jgi:tetratricopeptide (TPR) repeat protein
MLSNKATVYADLGLFNKEIELYKQSIKIAEAAFGREHPTIAIRLSNIAQSYLDQGQVAQGWPYIEESILISKKIFGSVHKRTADHMSVLGNYLIESGKFEEAESTLKEVINILKEIQKTENHISIASAHNSLGTLADRSGNFNKAEYHFSKAIDVAANSIGNDHKQTNTFRGNLALTLIKIKRWDLAEDILGKLTLYYETNHLLKNHPDAIRATAITQCLTSLNHICEV